MIRLPIVDDHAIVRDGLQRLVDREPDMDHLGVANRTHAALWARDRLLSE
jgi:DNA-binding NarL/FixJ family response regulator